MTAADNSYRYVRVVAFFQGLIAGLWTGSQFFYIFWSEKSSWSFHLPNAALGLVYYLINSLVACLPMVSRTLTTVWATNSVVCPAGLLVVLKVYEGAKADPESKSEWWTIYIVILSVHLVLLLYPAFTWFSMRTKSPLQRERLRSQRHQSTCGLLQGDESGLVQSQSAPSLSAPMYVAVEKEEAGGDASSVGFWLEDKLLTYSESVEGEGDESTAKIAMLR